MPSLPHRPALARHDGISSFVSVQSSDSYYSNEEIAILHDVVSAAQDNLDLLPEGERLATNALFQAYDAVLPNYGIDPEEDHHISRLVFRVGGERGNGSLLDKLRSVLARMGIELEFDSRSESSRRLSHQGDEQNDVASPPSSVRFVAGHGSAMPKSESSQYVESHQQDHSMSRSISAESEYLNRHSPPSKMTHAALGLNDLDHKSVELLEHPPLSHSPSTVGVTEQSRQSPRSGAGSNEHHKTNDTTIQPAGTAVALHSEKNKCIAHFSPVESKPVRTVNWLLPNDAEVGYIPKGHGHAITEHSTQHQLSHQDQQQLSNKSLRYPAEKSLGHDVDGHKQDGTADEQQKAEKLPRIDVGIRGVFTHNEQQLLQLPTLAEPHPLQSIESDPQAATHDEEREEDAAMEPRYSVLERRAAKASRYLQLLRGISHWKQYAIERLERTAVARRHIMRMRHFDPWELVTADTKLKGRRIFTSRLVTLWLKRTNDAMVDEHQVLVHAQQSLTRSALASWFLFCPAYTGILNQPRFLAAHIRRWQLNSSVSRALYTHADELGKTLFISRVCGFWQQHVLIRHQDAATFRRLSVVRDSLHQWQLETKTELFRAQMGLRLISEALSRWHSSCRLPPSRGPPVRHGYRRRINDAVDQRRVHLAPSMVSPIMVSQRMLKTKVLDTWQRQVSMSARANTNSRRCAAHQGAQKAVNSWYLGVYQNQNLFAWARRGCFYVHITVALSTWRSKGMWRSSTRKAYARCRQHVKTTFTGGYLSQWKVSSQLYANLDWQAAEWRNIVEQHRVVFVLNVWRDECNNDRGASRLLTAAWLGEWHGMSNDLACIQGRVKEVWEENLKSRYWGQWQSTLLRLKSREYVASDVRERNKKKLVRRLLLYWKGDRDLGGSQQTNMMRASFQNSRRDLGLGSNLTFLQSSRAVYDRPGANFRDSRQEEFRPTIEEEDHEGIGSGAEADGIVVDTPTRWTGMASSVRLPSMTPFAPLPTPFERELRERYNKSMPSAPSGQLSRLSFAQAQRLSAAEANTRQTKR